MDAKVDLTRDTIPAGVKTQAYLVVQVEGGEAGSVPDKPINLSLVIDRSGSMRGTKIEFVKQAALELIRRLWEKDTFSLVAYDDVVEVPIPTTRVGDKGVIRRAIRRLSARNMTDLSGGWLRGCDLVEAGLKDGQVTRVLLLSDGLANRGITSHSRLAAMARQKRSAGITTSTMGVGMDFNEDLLSRMALEGGGSFYFIDSPDQAPAFFNEELKDLQRVIGQNLNVRFDTGPVIRAVQQITDYPIQGQEGCLTYSLGELFAGETRVAVFELSLLAEKTGKIQTGEVEVSFDHLGSGTVEEQRFEHQLQCKVVKEQKYKDEPPSADLHKIILIQKSGRVRRKSVELADSQMFLQAAELLRGMAKEIEKANLSDEELLKERDMLLEEANDMEAGQERYDAFARKMHKSKSSHSHRHRRHLRQVEALHIRHLDSQEAFERQGPTPGRIVMGSQEILLEGNAICIGSSPDNDIILKGIRIAEYHCRLEHVENDWYAVPLVHEPIYRIHMNSGHLHGRRRLCVDDVLRFGEVVMHFRA